MNPQKQPFLILWIATAKFPWLLCFSMRLSLAPVVDEGGEVDVPLQKAEDEAVPYGGAPEPEAKPEEKLEEEQEAVPYGGAPEPEAKPEDKQEPADPREPPPARGEPLLTQKGPEADVATGGGTGCGCVLSHALLPFRMSGSDVALGTSGSALRVSCVLRVRFMGVPGDLRRGLHVSRVLQNGRLRLRVKMTKNGTRMRYSGDRQRSQQGRLLHGMHWAADYTHNRYNSTCNDDFIDKEWQWEWEEDVQNAADTCIVSGDKFKDSVQNAPSVSADQGPAEGQCGGGGNRRGTVDGGQWAVGNAHQRCAGTRCSVHCGAGGCRAVRPCLVGGLGRTTTHLLHQQPPVVRIPWTPWTPARKAGPRGRGGAEWCGGCLGSGAACGREGRRWGSGPKRGTAGGSGSGGGGMGGQKES